MRPINSGKKDIENSKDWRTETGIGCAGINNPRVSRKQNNPLKGIQNPTHQKKDNTFKAIYNLAQNGIRSQWPIGLTVQT